MLLHWVLPGSAFAVLLLACLPLARLRRLLLVSLQRLGHAVLISLVGAAGAFYYAPGLVPTTMVETVAPLQERLQEQLPNAEPGLVWLVLATGAVLFALPVLALLDHAAGVAGLTAELRRWNRVSRKACQLLQEQPEPAAVTKSAPESRAEVVKAREALAWIHQPEQAVADRPRLVRDMLGQPSA